MSKTRGLGQGLSKDCETLLSIKNLNITDPMTARARDVPEVRPCAGADMMTYSMAGMNIEDTLARVSTETIARVGTETMEPVALPGDGSMKTGNMSVTGTIPGMGGSPQVKAGTSDELSGTLAGEDMGRSMSAAPGMMGMMEHSMAEMSIGDTLAGVSTGTNAGVGTETMERGTLPGDENVKPRTTSVT